MTHRTRTHPAIQQWIHLWHTPSDLGLKLTVNGIVFLFLTLVMNHLVTPAMVEASNLPTTVILIYAAFHWLLWLTGGAMVLIGVARIFSIDCAD